MIGIPTDITLFDPIHRKVVPARIEWLSAERACDQIDAVWWNGISLEQCRERGVLDRDWKWQQLVREETEEARLAIGAAVCVVTSDQRIQGAAIYRIDGESLLQPGASAVYVEYLATAPWNRPKLGSTDYRGVGTELIRYLVKVSIFKDMKGRVNLTSLNDPETLEFYITKCRFVRTTEFVVERGEKLPILELSESDALALLEKRA